MNELGKWLVVIGVAAIAAGVVLILIGKTPLGRLPGDIVVRKDHFTFFFPLASSIALSVILSLILWLIFRFRR